MFIRSDQKKGRATLWNPANRFDSTPTPEEWEDETARDEALGARCPTEFLPDQSRSILSQNDSPDLGFNYSVNPYRGCEHGCIYCYARPTHEYLGYSAGLDFESKIMYKVEAPQLLQQALESPRWEPQPIAFSGVTDPYQPVENRLQLTRGCLEVLASYRNPAWIITKNRLVTRDIDVLREMAAYNGIGVFLSVTTLDLSLNRRLEPRSSAPAQRLQAIEALAEAGIPVGVMTAPLIPGLTDHEMPQILEEAAKRGASMAGYIMLRLPHAVAPLFENWLEQHYPDRKQKIMNRIHEISGGRAYNSAFGVRMRGTGAFAEQIRAMFTIAQRRHGLNRSVTLNSANFRRPGPEQLTLFG
ncbi:MAG: PA0069 family radical SAM protein [Candidatus Hydrogenedentes bacterium]|nr:PA0069 family radical SAM protein [Candidatus Hydrogenedentota bacterium]